MPGFTLIHPTVWPQYTSVTDSQTGQRSDNDHPKISHDFNHENRHSGTGYIEIAVFLHADFNRDCLHSGTPFKVGLYASGGKS